MKPAKFYAASRASLPERPEMWRRLRDRGVLITSSWIDEAGEGESNCLTDLWDRISREIEDAEALLLYVETEDFPLKGALIEAGMALGMGKRVLIIAPGVELDPRSMRPLGSWVLHPLVSFHHSIRHAVQHFQSTSEPLRVSFV
jgi:hypothetical protein